MKKKIWIPVVIVLVFILLAGIVFSRFVTMAIGTYIENGVVVFDRSQENPVVMLNQTGNQNAFSNLHTGDRVLVLHDNSMMLSYPAQINVFVCLRLKKGDLSNIPESLMKELVDMGLVQGN